MSDADSQPNTAPQNRVKAPRNIGKYELRKRLGAGGMGAVFLATDTRTKRSVALKVLPKDKAANQTLVKRFQSEAHAAANLEHENIVRVYEADAADGFLYISLEYIDGTDVDQILKKRERMPVKRAADIIKQTALALQHAHEQNIVHRDIKPSNIMIRQDGVVKLTDLGLARSVDESDDTNITRAGTTVGTVDYMAPEQARNSRLADIRSDLYSLGCTWYQMIVGHPPYHQGSLTNKLQAHARGPLPDPRDENPDVPESTVVMIHRLMAKKPEDRYQSPTELLNDLENSALHREALSDDVLSALAEPDPSLDLPRTSEVKTEIGDASNEESGSDGPADFELESQSQSSRSRQKKSGSKKSKSHRKSRPSSSAGASSQPPLPPRQRNHHAQSNSDERASLGVNLQGIKFLAVAALFVGGFIGIWYVLSSFASGIDPGGTMGVGESQRQTVRDMVGEDASIPIPKTGRRTPQGTDNSATEVTYQPVDSESNPKPNSSSGSNVSKQELFDDSHRSKAPLWARQIPVSSEVPGLLSNWKMSRLTVGKWKNQQGAYSTINSALEQGAADNIWVELIGPGPFLLNPVKLAGKHVVISRHSEEFIPSIICSASEQDMPANFFRLQGGTLIITGVNLLIDAQQFPVTGNASLFSIVDGHIHLREVSISLFGNRQSPTQAIKVSSSSESSPVAKTLIDRTLVRGAWSSLATETSGSETVLTQSLLLSGHSPVLNYEVSHSNQKKNSHLHSLLVVQSTLISSQSLIEMAGAENSAFAVTLEESQGISPEKSESTMVSIAGLPIQSSPATVDSNESFRWSTIASELKGWNLLLSSQTPEEISIETSEEWKSFWNDEFLDSEVMPEPWTAPQPVDVSHFDPSLWDDVSSAGFSSSKLKLPSSDAQEATYGIAGSIIGDAVELKQPPVTTVELDLDKTNLDEELKKTTWKSGTRFLLTGTKDEPIPPIVVDGRSFTLEMAADQSENFEIVPRNNRQGSLLSVNNGSLRLKNMRMRIPNRSSSNPQPEWMVNVRGGSLQIEDSYLRGPFLKHDDYRGIVRWESRAGKSLPNGYSQNHLLSIESSVLLTHGTAVSTSALGGYIRVKNSVLGSLHTAWSFDFLGDNPKQPALVDFQHSTFGAARSLFELSGRPDNPPRLKARFAVRDCLMVNPVSTSKLKNRTSFFTSEPGWFQENNLLWWGRANVWSTEIECFIREPGSTGATQQLEDWIGMWGGYHVQKPLYSPTGVIFKVKKREPRDLSLEHFQLDPKSRALRWSTTGSHVGADLSHLLSNQQSPNKSESKRPQPSSGF